jgi:hypothetical protein
MKKEVCRYLQHGLRSAIYRMMSVSPSARGQEGGKAGRVERKRRRKRGAVEGKGGEEGGRREGEKRWMKNRREVWRRSRNFQSLVKGKVLPVRI